jgi:ankyrin repeat protein
MGDYNMPARRVPNRPVLLITMLTVALLGLGSCRRNSPASPPICRAAWDGDLVKVQNVLRDDPQLVSAKDVSGGTPLDRAATTGHADIVRLLLANHADVNARNNDGMTPLYGAAESGYTEVAILLLASRANVNARTHSGYTPLHVAASRGRKDVTQLLLDNGADVNAKAEDGSTPLHWAVARGHQDVIDLLRQHGGIDLIAAQPHDVL